MLRKGKFFQILVSCITCASALNSQEKILDSVQQLDEIILKANTILGNKYVAQNRTGAAYFLSTADLNKFGNTDINRALQSVPGVTLYEEDGFGLRPNISLRGTSPQRSSKITLMEDGVLIAPAPYSAPAAYYFPSIARMEAVEILKGSSQIQYGPFTTGGAINMVSTSIPDSLKIGLRSRYGSFSTGQVYASVGQSSERIGYLVEYQNNKSNGFKELNEENTGFDSSDFMGKLRYSSSKQAAVPQYVELKYHFYNERSNETYLGLSKTDFDATPYLRYKASQEDQMNAEQSQFMLTHVIDFSDQTKIITNAYQNNFSRNWYKLDDVVFEGEKRSLASVVDDPLSFPNHFSILKGEQDTAQEASLLVKANNRVYTARGIQTKFDYHWYDPQGFFHDIEIGGRLHYDEEDRFQWEDGYSINAGAMTLVAKGPEGAQGNRISSARAVAAYVLYKYKRNALTLTPGIRFEKIVLRRKDYGKSDPNRNGNSLSTRENKINAFIPGIGFNYNLPVNFSVFGGIHKGFSPPGSAPGERAEESVNYELGTRFHFGRLRAEWIGYFNNYSNLLGSDLAASGGTGSLDQFNAGAVDVSGFEFLLNYNLLNVKAKVQIPLSLSYTLTNAIFKSDFGSTQGIWGEVSTGDRVPYIPQHQLNVGTSLIHKDFEMNFNLRYNGAFETQASNNGTGNTFPIPGNLVVDLSVKYPITPQVNLTANAINLFNNENAVARVPAGFRPGHPFGIYAGIEIQL
ncbi:TonB-dependent receptor [Flavobacteriaceae bacterium]|jgi:Fe(3+) dicitrate transport protein|nr:TonB-dependent receptor [Flavobacteriaceae bacterium]